MDTAILMTIAWQAFRETQRNRWFLLVASVFGGLALMLSFLGLSGLGTFGITGFGRTTASLLHLAMVIVPLMGLLMGAQSIAVEREQGTLVTLMAQPVTAGEVLIGKFLGNAAALTGAIGLGFGLSGAVIARYVGFTQCGDYAVLAALTLLLGLVHLAIGLWLSVITRRGATALGLALGAWLLIVFLSDLGVMGTAMMLRMSPAQLLWASLVNPAHVFKVGVIGAMPGHLDALGSAGRYAADALGPCVLPVMVGLLLAWTCVPLAGAWLLFRQRGAV